MQFKPKRSGRKSASTAMPKRTYKAVKRVVYKAIKKQEEVKYIYSKATLNANTSGANTCLNLLQQGTTAITRVGQKIMMKSLQWRMLVKITDLTGVDQQIRVLAFYCKNNNGTTPAYNSFLKDNAGNVTTLALRNLDFIKQYQCLFDKTYNLDTENDREKVFTGYMKLNKPVEFNSGNAGSIADINSGAIVLVVLSSQPSGDTDGLVYFDSRIRYTDA